MTAFVAITRGSLDMNVSDPETFVDNGPAAEAIQKTIANNSKVALDAVYVNLTTTSLLLTQQAVSQGSVKAVGSVKVDYEIRQIEATAAAANASAQAAASNLALITASQWEADIQTSVDSEAALNFSITVTAVEEPVADVIETPIVETTTTTSIMPDFEFVGYGSAAYVGCSTPGSCDPNYYQQTYDSLNSIDLEETCGEACLDWPCCFGYTYQADKNAGKFFCNIYTVNKTTIDSWTLYPSDYYNIGGVSSNTPGRTLKKKTTDPGCEAGTFPPTTTETTTTGTDF